MYYNLYIYIYICVCVCVCVCLCLCLCVLGICDRLSTFTAFMDFTVLFIYYCSSCSLSLFYNSGNVFKSLSTFSRLHFCKPKSQIGNNLRFWKGHSSPEIRLPFLKGFFIWVQNWNISHWENRLIPITWFVTFWCKGSWMTKPLSLKASWFLAYLLTFEEFNWD